MNYPSIRIEGAILSPDILDRLEELPGQKPKEFGLDTGEKVKDEIARAWADAQDYWRIFQRKLETVKPGKNATTETRNQWIVPLLSLLRYDIEYQAKGTELNGRIYAISHRVTNRADTSLHVIGYRDPFGLDKKPTNATRRMSAHALLQEFLNLHEQLYGLVTDGHVLRLLRDSSRLIKQSYLEFDLDRIFTDGLFADFAILYRLLHATRLPLTNDLAAESLIELYHQDSLDSGARIREGLSDAVEGAVRHFGNGFLKHPQNSALREAVEEGKLTADEYYKQLLRLIYRLLFLMVIEERDLVFKPDAPKRKRDIYRQYYSVHRLRLMSEKRYLSDPRKHDLWLSLTSSFSLFEADSPGVKLGIAPLAGDLFRHNAIGMLSECYLSNDVLLGCLRSLSLYRNPDTQQLIRVNYAALNVEEFGSVYEGLLEFEPEFIDDGQRTEFGFVQGQERAATGSHYTPDDLVQPLIKHSLDYLIADCLKEADPEKSLLGLKVADVACGSGHILLAAARRIATELAIVRTGEDQPSPPALRQATRDVIRNCIYGVDLNPLAVELCKVAMWLEAHNPGQPLNFLDHHIKCGNAIVGFAHREDLGKGVPDEAFKTLDGDDKAITATWRKHNKADRKDVITKAMDFEPEVKTRLDSVIREWNQLSALPELTPEQIDQKRERFEAFTQSKDAWILSQIAAIPIAQFYIPKTEKNDHKLISDKKFRSYWKGELTPQGQATAEAWTIAQRKRFFHWFLEFPEVMANGGFDCILGNPPYLGGQHLSGTYGYPFCEYVKWQYAPTGLNELVAFFLRRIYKLLKPEGFTAIITTNSITDGDIRQDGLDQIITDGGQINMAVRAYKWPGRANVIVSLLSLVKGEWAGPFYLDGKGVSRINAYFEEGEEFAEPKKLVESSKRVFQGSIFMGDGFLLNHDEAKRLCELDPKNTDVVYPLVNGWELNNDPQQKPGRHIINFHDWPIERAMQYTEPFSIVEEKVKPIRATKKRKRNREVWWIYAEHRPGLTRKLRKLNRSFVSARTTKHLSLSATPTNYVFSDAVYVFTTDRWDIFTVVQSSLHEVWARFRSGSLKQDLRYTPTKCFETFAFPKGLWLNSNGKLESIGERYHAHRKQLLLTLSIGLTDLYNLFHTSELSVAEVVKVSKKDEESAIAGLQSIEELRRLHTELDYAVRDAYGWHTLDLGHDFHEVETLPENDRIRYTVSPEARIDIVKRLFAENVKLAEEEARESKKSKSISRKRKRDKAGTGDLFDLPATVPELPPQEQPIGVPIAAKSEDEHHDQLIGEALRQLVALLRVDPDTTDSPIVERRHIYMDPRLEVAEIWGAIIESGISRKWISIGGADQRTIMTGERAPSFEGKTLDTHLPDDLRAKAQKAIDEEKAGRQVTITSMEPKRENEASEKTIADIIPLYEVGYEQYANVSGR